LAKIRRRKILGRGTNPTKLRRVSAGFSIRTGQAVGQAGEDFLAGRGPPLKQLNRTTLQALARRFAKTNDPRLARTRALIQARFRTEVISGSLRQQRLARAQAAVRKDAEARQSTQPDRFDKIIADTKQRDKVRADITRAGFDPANLRQASGRFVDKITTNESQRAEARRQVSIPISQRPAQITGRSQPKEGETILRSSELNQPKEFTLSLKESLGFSDRIEPEEKRGIPKTSAGFLRGAPVVSELIGEKPLGFQFFSIKGEVSKRPKKEKLEDSFSFQPTNPLLQPQAGVKSVFQEFINIGEGLGQIAQGKEVKPSKRVNTVFGDFISSGAQAVEKSQLFGTPLGFEFQVEFEKFGQRTVKKVQKRPLQVGGEAVGEFTTAFGLGSITAKLAARILPGIIKKSPKTAQDIFDNSFSREKFAPNIKFRQVPKDVFADDLARPRTGGFGSRQRSLGRGLGKVVKPRFDAGDVSRVTFGPSKPTKGGGTFVKPTFKISKGNPRTAQELVSLIKQKKITKATGRLDFKVTEFGKTKTKPKQSSKLDNLFAKPKQLKKIKTRDELLLEQIRIPGSKVRTVQISKVRQKQRSPLVPAFIFKQPTVQKTKLTPLLKQPTTPKLDTPFKPPRQPQRTILRQPTRTPTRLDTPLRPPTRPPRTAFILFPNFPGGGSRRGGSRGGPKRGRKEFQTLPVDPLRPGVILPAGVSGKRSRSSKIFGEIDISLEKARRRPNTIQPVLGDFGRPNLPKSKKGKKRKKSPLNDPFGF